MMKLFKRDKDAKTVEIGTVEYNKGWKFGFEGYEGLKDWLRGGVQFQGKTLKDKALFDKLPFVLRGDRLWVAANA
jgi:hypothetical protein